MSETPTNPEAPPKRTLIAAAICLAGFQIRNLWLGISHAEIPDGKFRGYSADQVEEFFRQIATGPRGLNGVPLFGWWGVSLDTMFPVVVALLVVWGLRHVFRWVPWPFLAVMPTVFVLLDWCENVTLARVAWSFQPPNLTPDQAALVPFASLCTQGKWTALGTTLLAMLLGAIFRRHRTTP